MYICITVNYIVNSRNIEKYTSFSYKTHRNTGTGYAWAKQSNVMLEFKANSTNSIVLVGTFGEALLIGSRRK